MKFVVVAIAALFASIASVANGQSCTHGDIRLSGLYYRTNPELEGHVEVCRNGLWGTICDSGWGNTDAGVVCRQLGHAYEGAIARRNSYYGSNYGLTIRMTNVGCYGTENRLVDCYYGTYISWYYCDRYNYAGVKCLPGASNTTVLETNITDDNTDIEAVRLVNKADYIYDNMGRLEVKYNNTWGTVCDTFWSYSNARVACRMLGFDDAACEVTSNQFGTAPSSTPYWMSNVQCTGSEDALDMCDFTGWGNIYSCSHTYNDAGVVCANTSEIGIPYNIRLADSATTTLTINWTVPELPSSAPGLRYSILYQAETSSYPSYTTLSGSGHQAGDEVTLTLNYLTIDTEYTIQVRVDLLYSPCTLYISGNYSEPMTFRTNATYKRSNIPVRLVTSYPGVDFLGRIEVFYNNQWGTVCDDLFSVTDGNIICRMLNFTRGAICTAGYYARFGQGTGQIWLDNVQCGAGDEILEDCDHNGWGVHNCGHYSDVGVICRPTLPAVKNLRVTSVAHTAITIAWSEHSYPRGVSSSWLQILYQSEGWSYTTTISSTATQYTLRNLNFDKEYNISIRARMRYSVCYYNYIYGEYSNEVTATTMETAPSGSPTLFTLEAINTTAIEAMWELPAINSRNGIIRGYKLFVLKGNVEVRNITISNNETLVYIVGGLERATPYTFSVLAYTVADGPKSLHLTISTLMHDPLIIRFGLYGNDDIDKVMRYTYNTGLEVHCTTSNDPSITSTAWYFANGTKVGLIDANFREGYYPHNKTAVLQIGLNRYLRLCDGGNYTCVVKTNASRVERRSFHLVIGTSASAPSRPTAIKIKSNSITIGWSQPVCDGGHIPSSFQIRYRRSTSSSYYSYSYATVSDSTQRNYTITGLSSTTSYDFSIQTTTVDSRTSSYSTVATIVTLPPSPSAPRNVSVKLVKPLLVEVSWKTPALPNGVVTHYTVYAKPLPAYEIDFRRKREATTPPKTIKKVFPGSVTSGNVTLTTQSITYQFQVSASTSHGQSANEGDQSPISANATIFVPEQGLPEPRDVITHSLTTNTSITLYWNYPPPPVETIESFFVTYSGDVEWRSPRGALVQFADTGEMTVTGTSLKVSPLIPGTRYHFKVSAVTPTGRGAEVSAFGTTQDYSEKLAYFQLQMTPVYNCIELSNPNLNLIDSFRSAIVEEINARVCSGCQVTTANIRNHEFSCAAGLTNHIVYRAMMVGTEVYSAPGLVSRLQSWVSSGSASITALSTRLYLDKNCKTSLDTLNELGCLQATLTETTTAVPTMVTKEMMPTTAKSVEKPEISKPIVSGQVGAGEIIGLLVGVVIIALLVVLIVVIIIIAIKRFKPKPIKSISHDRMFNASFSDIGSNRESLNLDDEHKEDILK